ncbi:hypothetical protein GGR50DRAFT_690056 [Xylaria sp. CBS 124048]|nr:hypothetical protein GGR50DRAFT_690056 [Xylaria sp. CBS 124048]
MASSANYDRPLPVSPYGQDQYYPPYEQQRPTAQDYQPQSGQQLYQSSYQQHPHYRQQPQQQQQQPPQAAYQQPPPPVKLADPQILPQQQQQPQQRTRPKSRAFSFRSDKSHKSANSHSYKINLTETSAEKEAKRLHSKADPRMALEEREPAMEAQTVSERPPLRAIQHRDANGNPIADPDRSNPTRSRWERPLDTIRGFEAAIDGDYNRKSLYRADNESVGNWNRRSSGYSGNNGRPPQDGWYGAGRPNRTDSGMYDQRQSAMMGNSRDSYYEGLDGGPYGNGGPSAGSRNKYPRNQSEPYYNGRGRDVYPIPNNHESYETVASGSGTGSMGEPVGYQTDPTSSENSSINRRSPPKRQEPINDYGINFGQSSYYQNPNVGAVNYAENPSLRRDPGTISRKSSKVPVNNGRPQERPVTVEKRKSWFMRRFSKNS